MLKTPNSLKFNDNPSNIRKRRLESSYLLWRILQCQSEVRSGEVFILKSTFLNTFKENELLFSELSDSLLRSVRELLERTCRHRLDNFTTFVMRVSSLYRKELINIQSPGRQLSFDILYQIVQLVSMNSNQLAAESVIRKMGQHEPLCSLTEVDREMVFRNYRAYIFITKQILNHSTLRLALDDHDRIMYEAAKKYTEVQIFYLESMFRTFIGQILLSRKYKCDALIENWMVEYGFESEHKARISYYIPGDCNFLHFRSRYRKAIISLSSYTPSGPGPEDSDIYLLRTLSNFYTSWLSKASIQIPA